VKDHAGRLGEYLNEPEKRAAIRGIRGEAEAAVRPRLASFSIVSNSRKFYHTWQAEIDHRFGLLSAVHLQQLRKALVSKDGQAV